MKRCIALICVLAILFTGCAARPSYPSDDAYHIETDDQYSLHVQGGFRTFAESEDGYFFGLTLYGNHFLFYTDKETLQTLPVCNKPNCLHYEETDEERRKLCGAFFMGDRFYPTVLYNDGRLLIPIRVGTTGIRLESFSTDGAERKEILSIQGIPPSSAVSAHRGYLYYTRSEYTEDMELCLFLLRRSLNSENAKEEVLFKVQAEETGDNIYDVFGYGNNVYFSVVHDLIKKFYHLDLITMGIDQIYNLDNKPEDACYNLIPFQDGLMCEITHPWEEQDVGDMTNVSATRYVGDLKGGNISRWQNTKMNVFTADDRYLYEWMFPKLEDPEEGGYLRVLDGAGEVVARCSLLEEVPDYMYLLVPLEGEHVFIACKGNGRLYYFPKSDIETGQIHPKLLIDCTQYQ